MSNSETARIDRLLDDLRFTDMESCRQPMCCIKPEVRDEIVRILKSRVRTDTIAEDVMHHVTNSEEVADLIVAALRRPATKLAPDVPASQKTAERDPSVMPDFSGADTMSAEGKVDDWQRELFSEINKAAGIHGLKGVLEHLRNWTAYIDDSHRQRYADLIEAQAKLIASYVNASPPMSVEDMARVIDDTIKAAVEGRDLPKILGRINSIGIDAARTIASGTATK